MTASPQPTPEVREHLATIDHPVRRRDADRLLEIMTRVSGQPAELHGSIIGFGRYKWHYESGRKGEGPAAAFASRKASTTIYLPDGATARPELLERLGKHKTSVGCLYVTDLDDVDLEVLEEVIASSYRTVTSGVFGQRAREGNA